MDASRTSSHAVLMELERGLRAAAPSVDTVLVFEASGEELGAIRVAGKRAAHFDHVRYRIGRQQRLPARHWMAIGRA